MIFDSLRLATVFSGIGAIEYAFKRLNTSHEIIFASDVDKYVRKSYLSNYTIDSRHWYGDVRHIDGKEYRGDVDLLVGGSPCQSFSIAGNLDGLEDPRGLLIYEFVRIVGEVSPFVFIYENVSSLLSSNSGKDWYRVSREMDKLGYRIYYHVLDSQDYGIPQQRRRLFVIGFREKSSGFSFPNPVNLNITMQDLLQDNVSIKFDRLRNMANKFNLLGDFYIGNRSSVNSKYYLSEAQKSYVMSPGTGNYYAEPETDRKIARTLLKTMHKMHRSGVDNYITYGDQIRRLTPRECLRLMGFDDRFKIKVSDTQMYRQCGNSIVVDVLMHLLGQVQAFENLIDTQTSDIQYRSRGVTSQSSLLEYF